ncbi:RICIN domain-containing protein [Kitasatospora sp. NPDC058201]|uniref:RICIN domain-containing protein n=1 Tax=unclassified Kitasatospora TaxID=2633591 RepID=UPI00364DDB39
MFNRPAAWPPTGEDPLSRRHSIQTSAARPFSSSAGRRLATSIVAGFTLLATSATLAPPPAAATIPAPDPAQAPYDRAKDAPVLIVLGQSNAEGWTAPLTDADQTKCRSLTNVKGLNRTDHRVVGATTATWSPYTCAGNNLGLEHGAEPKVGYNYNVASATALRWQRAIEGGTRLPDLNVIHIAWGSQGVLETEFGGNNRWWPDRDPTDIESLFPLAMNTISNGLRALQENGKRPRIIGIHWNQWEAEAKNADTTVNGLQEALLKVLNPLRTITGDTGAPIFLYRPRSRNYVEKYGEVPTQRVTEALTTFIAKQPAPHPYRMLDAADATTATGTSLYNADTPPNYGIYADSVHYTPAVHEWFAAQQWKTVFTDGQYGTPVKATVNAALGRPATQSSTSNRGFAARAADGNTSGASENQSLSQTKNETRAWWQTDLGARLPIRSVELFNRTGEVAKGLTDFYVVVSATDLTGRSWASIEADPAVKKIRIPGTAPTKLTVPVGADGRFVRVQLAGTNQLTLAEVRVNATPDGVRTLTIGGKALGVPAASKFPGSRLSTRNARNDLSQKWTLTQQRDGNYTLVNQASGLCADVTAASYAPGTRIIQWRCTGHVNQRWTIASVNGGYTIASADSKLLLTTASTANGALITQQAASRTALQKWNITDPPTRTAH